MKKLAVLLAIVSVAVLAAPALSATNPFMDVPMNHWAYDAIGQLAAHGILSGYPDGLYKGKQPTTRYEMASALARALAVVDMTKASKQDVEMLKQLVVEFHDELEALGVRVDELDERVRVLESRLGGWHIHGSLVLDVQNRSAENALRTKNSDGDIKFDEARLFFERTWGEDGEYFFRARLRNEGDSGTANKSTSSAFMDRFYVEMPFFGDTRLMLGRNNWDWESAYRVNLGTQTGSWMGDSVLTDWTWTGLGLTKNFGMGQVQAVFAHPGYGAGEYDVRINGRNTKVKAGALPAWMIMARGVFQFTEQFGFDIGGQAFIGDNAETYNDVTAGQHVEDDYSFNKLWTIYGGLRFNFNENIAIKAAYYYQKMDSEVVATDPSTGQLGWYEFGYGVNDNTGEVVDNAKHWRAIIDVKQDALKFTSLWLEYGQYDAGFYAPQGMSTFFNSESSVLKRYLIDGATPQMGSDLKYWRVILGQQWTDAFATHIFYNGYKVEDAYVNSNGDYESAKPSEYGVGVQYKLNDYTTMGLNYIHVDSDGSEEEETKDNIIRFRTAVSF
jgi:hypothetical protein